MKSRSLRHDEYREVHTLNRDQPRNYWRWRHDHSGVYQARKRVSGQGEALVLKAR